MAAPLGAGGRQLLQRLNPGTTKHFTRGTHRIREPAATLAAVHPLLPAAGITRLADITGLDRIGIPVVVGVRPNARVLSQSAGKGITLELARVSAAMEGIELFHAEAAQPASVTAAYAELSRQHTLIPIDQLPLSRHAVFSPTGREVWTFGRDLLHARHPVGVPLECVVLPMRSARPASLFSFQTTSNGLASGNSYIEALVVALLELIERDAIAASRGAAEWFGVRLPRVGLEGTRQWPLVRELLERIESAGLRVLVYDCSIDTRVPVFLALLYDAGERQIGVAEGGGAHLDPELALVRALTEAIQARGVGIAGARDDRFGRDLARIRLTDSHRRVAMLEAQPCTVDVHAFSSEAAPSFTRDMELLLDRLARVGIQQAIAFDLTLPDFGDALSVVRVVVPGLDGPGMVRDRPSPRAAKLARLRTEATS